MERYVIESRVRNVEHLLGINHYFFLFLFCLMQVIDVKLHTPNIVQRVKGNVVSLTADLFGGLARVFFARPLTFNTCSESACDSEIQYKKSTPTTRRG